MELLPQKRILGLVTKAYAENRRLVAPLATFPGCDLTGFSIKVAQQNHGIHFACISAIVKLLKPDIAFIMMDLSVEANALGLPVRFPIDQSSTVEKHPIDNLDRLDNYRRINILQDSRIQSYIKTIEMMSIGLPRQVIKCAYVVGPVTLAGLLESAQQLAMDSILDPEKLHGLCRFSTEVIQEYVRAIINAGANLICILEPTAVVLGPEQFRQFSGYYVHHIIESYKYANVETIYHVCGNTMHLLKEMVDCGITAVSLDSPETGIDMVKALQIVPEDIVVMGNINPTSTMKDGTIEEVRQKTTNLLEKMRPYPNFLLSTGCDLPPGTPAENMQEFMRVGREFK